FADLRLQPVRLHALRERFGHLFLEPRVGVDDVPVLRSDLGHHAPNRVKIQFTMRSNIRSSPHRYTPKNAEVRMTTTVVAYTSLRVGQVTRRVSFRTSAKNVRAFSGHALMPPPSDGRTAPGLTCSSVLMRPSWFLVPRSTGR